MTAVIKEVLAGNRDAFRTIVSTYQAKVYATAFQATRDRKEAEDLAQEIFLKAYRSLQQFRFESSFSTWLFKIAVHKALDWKRKHSSKAVIEELTSQTQQAQCGSQVTLNNQQLSTEAIVLTKESELELHRKIKTLPEHYQKVIQMYHFQDKSYREIAELLQIPEKTVETRLYRAKQKLRELSAKEEFM
ncbi:RNA polymerase sigma factor [Desulfuribacillus alkaliarsenatis]|uniref:RNA polymerase sigma factor n=1 Tax=Desulfuribacillus alkaliarsenatis TaxID=766136 RepID=UPI0026595D5A|nr:RNA polymerase sigma factor [Desulfuribacillus alkaliarsenatis]